jgi:pyruvate/2-oxoglutarate dehydrogenase complex dihydrolipoamide dehydrogenase (E3) component
MSAEYNCDIAIIGAGSGGLSVAAAAAMLGVKVALVENDKMGGDCLNYGCVPSKSLLAAAKCANAGKIAQRFGMPIMLPDIKMSTIMQRVHKVIAAIAPHDSVERFTKLGVKVFAASAKFIDGETIQAGDAIIRAKRYVIATGSSPAVPPIPGLQDIAYLTNETIFNLEETPSHLIVIGGGPIGCELAQAFLLLGVRVTMLEAFNILPRDEQDLVALLRAHLIKQGLTLHEGIKIVSVKNVKQHIEIVVEENGKQQTISGSHLLVAAGRKVNVDGLSLDKAGVVFTPKGIQVDESLRTSNKRVYAIGDVAGGYQFTHIANYHAGIVIRNILFKLPAKVNYAAIPWVTYTDLELAHVGLLTDQALKKDPAAKVLSMDLSVSDRAQAEREVTGKIKIVVDKKGRVYGVSILAPHAGELLLPWIMIIREKKTLRSLTDCIVPYPTYSELSKRIAGEFYAPKLFSPLVKWVVRLLQWF